MPINQMDVIYFDSSSVTVSTGGLEQVFLPSNDEKSIQTVLSDAVQFSFQKRTTMGILTATVNDFIVNQFSKIPDVNYIYAQQTGDVFYVWVVLKDSGDELLDRAIDAQQFVMREFRQFAFDFNIVFQMGRDVTELIAPATPLYQRA
ncbi:MAG: hypothetical protein ACR2IV_13565 [Bryobacteraceae bacterium]